MRKIICFFIILSTSILLFTSSVSADSVADGAVNSTAQQYFTGIISKLPPNYDYFLYKAGDYDTALITGSDLKLNSSGTLTGSDNLRVYHYNTRYQQLSAGQWRTGFTVDSPSSVIVNTTAYSLAYSSLGRFPELSGSDRNSNTTLTYILYSVCALLFFYILFKLFRNRRHYINL